ncbi:MAG: thiamine-phosphate kinase [Gammaproteobacteria bacterium]|nr:MAG: thiamine-phosphate kinase [Gammaproteobacteria bacterium]
MRSLQVHAFDTDRELVVAIDTLVGGVHFATATAPIDVGFKALAVNLSDLAAMGAEPLAARASLTHPDHGEDHGRRWLAAFEQGLGALGRRHGLAAAHPLTARGPLCVTVEALGTVPRGMALRRDGAAPGDRILVTGTLGDAGLALAAGSVAMTREARAWLQARLARPEPRIEAGIALRGLASAAIDISDGLVADLAHILAASGAGARLTMEDIPLSAILADELPPERAWELALSSGDDYELCFTVASHRLAEVERRLRSLACGFAAIGTVTANGGLQCLRADGRRFDAAPGYRHFP